MTRHGAANTVVDMWPRPLPVVLCVTDPVCAGQLVYLFVLLFVMKQALSAQAE